MTHPTDTREPTPLTADSDAANRPAPAPRVGVWEDFIDIFHAPSAVFARREKGSYWIPLLVVTLVVGVFYILNSGALQPIMDAEFRRSMEAAMRDNPQITPEMAQQMRGFGEMMAKVMAFIGVPIVVFLLGITLWVAGKFVNATQTLHAALVVAAYSYVPRALESILTGVQAAVFDVGSMDGRFRLSFGLGRFLDPDTTAPALLALAGRVDVFTIWVTVLVAIGLSVTGRVSRGKAAIAAVVVWIVGALPTVLPALRQ